MTFSVARTRFEFSAGGQREETNRFRGALGAALHESSPAIYARWFDPRWPEGPSGYRDAPRPFVLRGVSEGLDLISFLMEQNNEIEQALEGAIRLVTNDHNIDTHRLDRLELTLEGTEASGRLRLEFTTPTEIKSAGRVLTRPDFFPLVERLAERVWALGRLYQDWPEQSGFRDLLTAAQQVELVAWEWSRTDWKRRSARSGEVHSIGGYTGWAEYHGPLGRVLPLLEIGRWTGVGRQTVWGKGEFQVAELEV
jgi:CRISPR/Cas system endoribonuclease Cas6 (RAMP superfamily)